MASIDGNNVERMAVTHIESIINRPYTYLQSHITVGDKGVSYDGTIDVFDSHSQTKKNFSGSVPVQVKGKYAKKFSKTNNVSYSISVDDLRNYYNNGGAIFFYTLITAKNDFQVFYKMLLPLDLKVILERVGEQKTKSVKLKIMNPDRLTMICKRFLKESAAQPKALIQDNNFQIEDFKNVHFTIPTIDTIVDSSKGLFDSLIGQQAYLYGSEKGISYPLSSILIKNIGETGEFTIDFNEEEITYTYEMIYGEKTNQLFIENSFIINFTAGSMDAKFDIFDVVTLKSYKKILVLLRKMNKDKKLSVLDDQLIIENPKGKIFEELDELINQVNKVEMVFNYIGIPLTYTFAESQKLSTKFFSLIEIFLNYNLKILDIDKKLGTDTGFINFKLIEGLKVYLFYDERKSRKFINVFSKEALNTIAISTEKDIEKSRLSMFCAIDPNDLTNYLNYNLETVKQSFDRPYHIVNSKTLPHSDRFALGCLKTFDKNPDKDLLEIAEKVFQVQINAEYEDTTYTLLNFYQTLIRKGDLLTEHTKEDILEIKDRAITLGAMPTVTACCILLKSTFEARYYLNKMSEEEREEFLSFPIYNLLVSLEKNGHK